MKEQSLRPLQRRGEYSVGVGGNNFPIIEKKKGGAVWPRLFVFYALFCGELNHHPLFDDAFEIVMEKRGFRFIRAIRTIRGPLLYP
jgi:hypothetical protein